MLQYAMTSELAQHDKIGELTKPRRARTKWLERAHGILPELLGEPFGLDDAQCAHVGGLVLLCILPRGLAEGSSRRFRIEHVVDHLIGKAHELRESVES